MSISRDTVFVLQQAYLGKTELTFWIEHFWIELFSLSLGSLWLPESHVSGKQKEVGGRKGREASALGVKFSSGWRMRRVPDR